ncbi:MAG: TetR/AcrR family transcriptional regulator [Proteobacteria bacterium]|nr:TetR/AcrR family transcriptional regulator [Pseudomonadota bacterium]
MKPGKTFNNLAASKQTRIIKAALGEFSQAGYSGTKMGAIAERVGIAKGSMFQYFGSKKRLFLFLFERTVDRVKDQLRGVRDQTSGDDVFTRIEKTLLGGVSFVGQHPRIYSLYLKVMFDSGAPLRQEMIGQLRADSLGFLRELLETGRDRGELRPDLDLDLAAFVLDSVFDRFLQALALAHLDAGGGMYRADEATIQRRVKGLVDILRRGLGPSP